MAQQTINVGAAPNDGTGTPLRTAFQYTNSNFTELYTAVGPSGNNIVVPGSATISGDLTVDTNTLFVDSANNRVGILTASPSVPLEIRASDNSVLTTGGSANFTQFKAQIDSGAGAAIGAYQNLFGYVGTSSNHYLEIRANNIAQQKIEPLGIFSWFDGAGGTRMTLNSTGLGVGVSPLGRFHVRQSGAGIQDVGYLENAQAAAADVGPRLSLLGVGSVAMATVESGWNGAANTDAYLSFRTRGSGAVTERLRIDSSGNVGIGVTPSAWSASWKTAQVGSRLVLTVTGSDTFVGNNWYNDGAYKFINADYATYYDQTAGKHVWGTSTTSGAVNGVITWNPAMTLDASGNLLVGTTTNTNASRIFSRGTATSSALALQGASGDFALAQLTVGKFDNNTTTSQIFVRFTINDNSGGSGQINANGASQAAFGTFSDSRLKENIVSLPSQLANILSLRPVEFDYKDGSGHQIGFVAQEMQEVYSDSVGEQNGFLTVTGWSKTEARLVSAIKELAAKVQALEAKLA